MDTTQIDTAIRATVHQLHADGRPVRIADILDALAPLTSTEWRGQALEHAARDAVVEVLRQIPAPTLGTMLSADELEGWADEEHALAAAYFQQAEDIERYVAARRERNKQ